jgi:hypothetical protein
MNGNMIKRFKLWLVILLGLGQNLYSVCLADSPIDTEPNYQWGRGLSVPQIDLTLGGYVSASFKQMPSQQNIAALDDLSLFMTWSPHDRVRFFSEIELEDWLSSQGVSHLSTALKIERLYVDFLATDSFKVRLGKFLTPFGIWNVIHASPLVWTTVRPLATNKQVFPSHASGLLLNAVFVVNEQNLDVSAYIDNSTRLDPRGDEYNFDHAFGGRIRYEIFTQFQIGLSYLAFKNSANSHLSRNHLWGVDMLWKKNDYELQMEFSHRTSADRQGKESNFYLQGVVPLPVNAHLFAVGRYEYFAGDYQLDSNQIHGTAQIGLIGLTWRPYTPLVFKAEYRFSNLEQMAPSGFFTSLSMLF